MESMVGQETVIVAGGSQAIFVYKMELRDTICKQFLSRKCSDMLKVFFVYLDCFRWQTNSGKRRFFVAAMATLGE